MVEALKLGYDLDSLPDPRATASPRLGYDMDSVDDYQPAQGVVTHLGEGYGDYDIVVNGGQSPRYPARTVKAPYDCVTRRVGWEKDSDHKKGYGYRAYCDRTHGKGGIVIGHMEPDTIPASGTLIRRGEPMGRYGNPTTGDSDGPHLHRGEYDQTGRLIPPNLPSPFYRGGQRTSPYGPRKRNGKSFHKGEDWVE